MAKVAIDGLAVTDKEVGAIDFRSGVGVSLSSSIDNRNDQVDVTLNSLPNYGFRTGWYYSTRGSVSTGALTQDRLYTYPLLIPSTQSFDRIGVRINTGVPSAVMKFGIYSDDGYCYPGALYEDFDAQTVDMSGSAADQELTISLTLPAGLYWVASVSQGAAANVATFSNSSHWNMFSLLHGAGTSTIIRSQSSAWPIEASVSGALPATFTTTAGFASPVPATWLRAA